MTIRNLASVKRGFLAIGLAIVATTSAQTKFEMKPPPTDTAELVQIPWVKNGNLSWRDSKPTFDLPANEAGTAAKGWFAVSAKHILARIVVVDDAHFGRSDGKSSWKDDCIQIAFDPLDNGAREAPKPVDVEAMVTRKFPPFEKTDAQINAMDRREKGRWQKKKRDYDRDMKKFRKNLEKKNRSLDNMVRLDPDDADFCFGRKTTDDERFSWSFYHAIPGREGARPLEYCEVEYKDGKLIYDLQIPWSEFGIEPGLAPVLRVGLKVHDRDKDGGEDNELVWGGGVGGKFQPCRFKRLALGAPKTAVSSVALLWDDLQKTGDSIEVWFGGTKGSYKIETKYGDESKGFDVNITSAIAQRWLLITPKALPDGLVPLSVRVLKDGNEVARLDAEIHDSSMENWYAWQPKQTFGTLKDEQKIEKERRSRDRKLSHLRHKLSKEEIEELQNKKLNFEIKPEHVNEQLSIFKDSVLDMKDWISIKGQPKQVAAGFEVDGKPFKIWGTNVCSGGPSPPKTLAVAQARKYAKYGVNCVRLHKFSNHINSKDDSGWFDEEALDNFDYFTAQLKKQGIYYGLDPFFYHRPSPYEIKMMTIPEEEIYEYKTDKKTGEKKRSRTKKTYAVINLSHELQEIRMKWMKALLEHVNPYTGVAYKDEPAIAFVEFQNEDGIFWYSCMPAMFGFPTYGKRFCGRFSDWLKKKYGSHEELVKAWGKEEISRIEKDENGEEKEIAYYFYTKKLFPGEAEHLDKRNIFSIPNPWFYTPFGLNDQKTKLNIHERLIDNVNFLLHEQRDFYARFKKTVRDAGYKGPLIGSCWQGAEGITHFANLFTDYEVGFIDRHNYSGGGYKGWWVAASTVNTASNVGSIGGGSLNSGLQQVANSPFSLSEWTVAFPCQWRADSPSIIAAYGLGLLDWDASYQFASDNGGNWSSTTTQSKWDINLPDNMGQYPAIARMVYRADIRPGEVVSLRKICMSDMMKTGEVGFEEKVTIEGQLGDYKNFGGFVPQESLAVGQCLVEYVDTPQESSTCDPKKYLKNGAYQATNGQLRWFPLDDGKGYILINSKGTKAVLGFSPRKPHKLDDVTIDMNSYYGSLFVTSLQQDRDLSNAQTALIQAIGRTRNTGMTFDRLGRNMKSLGDAPILLEPIHCTIRFNRPVKQVNILDHDGCRTGETVPVNANSVVINTAMLKSPYFEVVFK